MITHRVIGWFGTRPKTVKRRHLSCNARRHDRIARYRRLWWWYEERWNARHLINKDSNG